MIFSPRINKRALNHWDKIYLNCKGFYDSTEPDQNIIQVDSLSSTGSKRKILDLGSGLGRNGCFFLDKGDDVTFVDSSKIANDVLVKYLLDRNLMSGYAVIEEDVVNYLSAEKDEIFDIVLAIHIISHGTADTIYNSFLKNIYRVLKAGGIACITLPSTQDTRCPRRDADIIEYALEDGPEIGISHTFYSRVAIMRQLRGFEIIEIQELTNQSGNSHWNVIMRKPSRETNRQ